MNVELKEQVRVAAYDANDVPAISPDERIRVYTSKEHVCHCIPITNRSLGLTVPILEDGKTVEYWFEKGIRDADLVLKHNSSIGDEYIFDDNVFKVVSLDQIKHRIYLKNPNIELTEDSFIYGIYDEQTDKRDTFKIGNADNSIYLDLTYINNNTEKNYFHFDKNQFKVDIDGKITLKYNNVQNGIVSKIGIVDDISLSYSNGNDFSELVVTETVDINSSNAVNIVSKRIDIRGDEGFNGISGTTNSTAAINIENRGTGHINLVLDNNDSNNDILIKNLGHGDINIDSQYAVHIQGANSIRLYGSDLAELNSTQEIDITCGNEVVVHSPTILIEPTTRFTVNGASGFKYLINYQQNVVSISDSSNGKQISLNSTNGVELCNNSGTSYFRLYDAPAGSDDADIEMGIGSSNLAGNIYIKNNGSGSISVYRNNNHIKTQLSLDALSNGYLMRESLYETNLKVKSLVSVNDKQVLIRAYDDSLTHERSYPCNVELRTGDHAFNISTNNFEIGKLDSNNTLSYQEIPECIYPLMYDLKYSNNTNIGNGGYWKGNAGQTDLRNIQRFTSIIPVDNDYSYIEFKKQRTPTIAYLSNDFNIKTFARRAGFKYDSLLNVNGKSLTFESNKNDGTNTTTIELSFDEDYGLHISFISSGIYISLNETEISFTDSNNQVTYTKTWQQLLS